MAEGTPAGNKKSRIEITYPTHDLWFGLPEDDLAAVRKTRDPQSPGYNEVVRVLEEEIDHRRRNV